MGLSFTKRESKLQNEILIYKTGFLDYKWDSRVAIHQETDVIWDYPYEYRKETKNRENADA